MRTADGLKTRSRILKAAEELFAEKGFDGARVDDIAEKAGVNKALIYYYFKSKKDILDELFSNLIEEFAKMAYDSIEDAVDFESMEYRSDENMLRLTEIVYKIMEDKEDTIRIMIMESLKASEEKPPLFRFSELLMSDEAEMLKDTLKERGIDVDDIDIGEQFIADFFTGLMPMFSFVVYGDKWSKYFHIDKEDLKTRFFTVFLETHLAYHKAQLMKMK